MNNRRFWFVHPVDHMPFVCDSLEEAIRVAGDALFRVNFNGTVSIYELQPPVFVVRLNGVAR